MEQLAKMLDRISAADVEAWMTGDQDPCAQAFLDMLDIVAHGEVRRSG